MRQKVTIIPQAMHIPGQIISQGLSRSLLAIVMDIAGERQTGDLGCWIRGIAINLFLLGHSIPALWAAIVRQPIGATRGKSHFQTPDEPVYAIGHVRRP